MSAVVPAGHARQYIANSLPVPANLFSHADQQQQWQTLELDGFYKTGWAAA